MLLHGIVTSKVLEFVLDGGHNVALVVQLLLMLDLSFQNGEKLMLQIQYLTLDEEQVFPLFISVIDFQTF